MAASFIESEFGSSTTISQSMWQSEHGTWNKIRRSNTQNEGKTHWNTSHKTKSRKKKKRHTHIVLRTPILTHRTKP